MLVRLRLFTLKAAEGPMLSHCRPAASVTVPAGEHKCSRTGLSWIRSPMVPVTEVGYRSPPTDTVGPCPQLS